jgi:hypothetical protein
MISSIWKNPLIKIDKQEQFTDDTFEGMPPEYEFESINLGDSCSESYDNMLFSGSNFTGDKLISKENEALDKYKGDYDEHDHNDH